MGNKSINWRKVLIIGLMVGIVGITASSIFCITQPQTAFAKVITKIIGEQISFGNLISYLILFSFFWSVIIEIIKKIYEKLNAQKQFSFEANIPGLKVFAKVIIKNSVTTSQKAYWEAKYVYVFDSLTITFETTDGRRLVFPVTQEQYGMYLEGDTGILTYKEINGQLTFINFERQIQPSN